MAKLRAKVQTYTNGKVMLRESRLGEDQADAEVGTYETIAKTSLFADGSGRFTVTRGEQVHHLEWNAESFGGDLEFTAEMPILTERQRRNIEDAAVSRAQSRPGHGDMGG